MIKRIDNTSNFGINAELKNSLYAEGFRYLCEGDYRTLGSTDPWSGMPNTACNLYFFTDKAEAEAFAKKQIWVFNPNVHATVHELPAHTETWEEIREKEAKAKALKAKRKAEREAAEAKKKGMTVEQLRESKKIAAQKRRYTREIADFEKQIADLQKAIAYRHAWIAAN